LPEIFGKWNTIFKRFNDWSAKGAFKRMFKALSDEPDMEYAMMDAMIIPVHRHGHGAKGRWTTKILALTNALGNLMYFCLLPGNRYDTVGLPV